MESTIFKDMNKLLIISIIVSVVSFTSLFGYISLVDKEENYTEESRAVKSIDSNGILSYIILVPLFVGPAAVSGIIASFFKTVKLQIIVWAVITLVFWLGIMILALLLFTDPTSFGIPEKYWEP